MEKELVSIIIPTYKTNYSLKRAVDSVLNQTYDNIEIIVVDDNGDDEYRIQSKKIMDLYKNNSNIKYIVHGNNKNGSAARNTGFKHSKGKYIGFLDDDDFFLENKIEKQVEKLKQTNSDFCCCYYYRNKRIVRFPTKKDYSYEIFMNYPAPQTSSFLIERQKYIELDGFDESYFRHQDYEFLMRVSQSCEICVVEEPLYHLDKNGVNNVPNGEKMEIIKDKFLEDFGYLINEKKYNKKKIIGRNYSLVYFAYIKNKNKNNARRILSKYLSFYFLVFLIYRIMISIRYKLFRV